MPQTDCAGLASYPDDCRRRSQMRLVDKLLAYEDIGRRRPTI